MSANRELAETLLAAGAAMTDDQVDNARLNLIRVSATPGVRPLVTKAHKAAKALAVASLTASAAGQVVALAEPAQAQETTAAAPSFSHLRPSATTARDAAYTTPAMEKDSAYDGLSSLLESLADIFEEFATAAPASGFDGPLPLQEGEGFTHPSQVINYLKSVEYKAVPELRQNSYMPDTEYSSLTRALGVGPVSSMTEEELNSLLHGLTDALRNDSMTVFEDFFELKHQWATGNWMPPEINYTGGLDALAAEYLRRKEALGTSFSPELYKLRAALLYGILTKSMRSAGPNKYVTPAATVSPYVFLHAPQPGVQGDILGFDFSSDDSSFPPSGLYSQYSVIEDEIAQLSKKALTLRANPQSYREHLGREVRDVEEIFMDLEADFNYFEALPMATALVGHMAKLEQGYGSQQDLVNLPWKLSRLRELLLILYIGASPSSPEEIASEFSEYTREVEAEIGSGIDTDTYAANTEKLLDPLLFLASLQGPATTAFFESLLIGKDPRALAVLREFIEGSITSQVMLAYQQEVTLKEDGGLTMSHTVRNILTEKVPHLRENAHALPRTKHIRTSSVSPKF